MEFLHLIRKVRNAGYAEILFRLGRKARLTYDSCLQRQSASFIQNIMQFGDCSGDITPHAYKEHWQTKDTFYFSPDDHSEIESFLLETYPQKVEILLRKADEICNLEIELFNKKYVYATAIDWQNDPVSGMKWPSHHWSKIKVVGRAGDADAKFVWELNRHQFLVYTAMAYYVSGNEKYAVFTLNQIVDWIEKNPIGLGINWVESLEVGSRLVSWIWILELLRGAEYITENLLATVVLAMHSHAKHLHHYPSHYISPNTHLTGEALALFLYSAVYPEDLNSQKWENEARLILDRELDRQVGGDGVHKELSTAYHSYTLDYYFQYIILCRRREKEVNLLLLDRLEKMCEFAMLTERPDGSMPLLGDSDGGAALFLDPDQASSWKPALCNGAILFDRADFKHRSPALCWQSVWLWGNEVIPKFRQIPLENSQQEIRYFTDSNYIVYRSDWTDRADYLLFDAGQMGFLSAGHSHADYLSFELAFAGKSYIRDVGTLSYHDQKWRNYSKGTRAHNTVIVNNKDQVVSTGSFSWDRIPEKGDGRLEICQEFVIIQSAHRAYQNISHTRVFIVVRGQFVLCFDVFTATERHHYEFNYHFSPGVVVSSKNGTILADGKNGDGMVMIPLMFQTCECTIKNGCSESGQGFYFPTYGEKVPVYTVSLAEHNDGSFTRGMLFCPVTEKRFGQRVGEFGSDNNPVYSFTSNNDVFMIKTNLHSYIIDVEKHIMVDCDFLIERSHGEVTSSFLAVGVGAIWFSGNESVLSGNKLCYVYFKKVDNILEIYFAESDKVDISEPVECSVFHTVNPSDIF